jgi:hypothetical protein
MRKKTEPACLGGGSDGPSGKFWTQWIEPKGAALLAERMLPCHIVVKNHGLDPVMLVAQHGDLYDLNPGQVRGSYTSGQVRVENRSERHVLIEFEFLPIYTKR